MSEFSIGEKVYVVSYGEIIETEIEDIKPNDYLIDSKEFLYGVRVKGIKNGGIIYLVKDWILKTQREAEMYIEWDKSRNALRKLWKDLKENYGIQISQSLYLDKAEKEINEKSIL